ncbi:hypothetical protein [Pedobacter duraquae]|uniref:Entericidin n=1 Tax=Pedobacter duraquae TaxID=425511 RepID=A0A4R6IDS7_9SPHI|nr:hypothetical protein [Pedobacter duraquae]TDO20104.1 hypothetical protein CLV32_3863 [Pedobacter duraquae]
MKHVIKMGCAFSFAALLFSACTMGDKGSEKVPDSLSIDTTQQSSMSSGTTTTGMDSAGADSTTKDSTTMQKK